MQHVNPLKRNVNRSMHKGILKRSTPVHRKRWLLSVALSVFAILGAVNSSFDLRLAPQTAQAMPANQSEVPLVLPDSGVVAISDGTFPGTTPTDASSVRWKELANQEAISILKEWDESFRSTDGSGGYYNEIKDGNGNWIPFGGNNSDIRTAASFALALAIALKTNIIDYDADPDLYKDAETKTATMIASLAYRHRTCAGSTVSPTTCSNIPYNPRNPNIDPATNWGFVYEGDYINWDRAWFASYTGFAGWLLWADLSPFDRQNIRNMVEYEADRFIDSGFIYYTAPNYGIPFEHAYKENVGYRRDKDGNILRPEDTAAEESAWDVRILQVATAMMPKHPHWDAWMTKQEELSISAFSRPYDLTLTNTKIHDKSVANWLNGSNVEGSPTRTPGTPDALLVNGQVIHPTYMMAMNHKLQGILVYSLAHMPTPKGVMFNADQVYDTIVRHEFTYPGACGPDYPPDLGQRNPCYDSPGGKIYSDTNQVDSRFYDIYYPMGPNANINRKLDVFAQMDAYASAFGFGKNSETYPQIDNNPVHWEDLHTTGLQYLHDNPSVFPPTSQLPPPGAAAGIARMELIKGSEAYLAKWLAVQPYFAAPTGTDQPFVSDVPTPWRDIDLGTVAKMGRDTYVNGTYTVVGSGSLNNSYTADQIHFTHQVWYGDGQIVARMPTWTPSSAESQAGVMIRNDLTAESSNVWMQFKQPFASPLTPYFRYRTADGLAAQSNSISYVGSWLKLVRKGNTFTGYTSSDGLNWTLVATQTINMNSRVFVGLAVSSWENGSTSTTAQFDNVNVLRDDLTFGEMNLNLPTSAASAPTETPTVGNPGDVLDNNTNTWWGAAGSSPVFGPRHIQLNLGALRKVGSVSVGWLGAATPSLSGQRIQHFEIQAQNGLDWTTVFTGTSSGRSIAQERYYFMPVATDAIRIVGYNNSTGPWISIHEADVYGGPLEKITVPSNEVTASTSQVGHLPAATIDGDINTYWAAEGDGQWIQYHLTGANPKSVRAVSIGWLFGDIRTASFDIQVSTNGTTWITALASTNSSGSTRGQQVYTFPSAYANIRYVRIVGHGNSDSPWNSISEVGIYGLEGSCSAVNWTNQTYVRATGNSIERISAPFGWTAGAISTQSISTGSGYVWAIADVNNQARMFGLSKGDTNTSYEDIDFAIYLKGNGLAGVYQAGIAQSASTTYVSGDVFKVAVESGVVKYYKNGTVFYTRVGTITSSAYPLGVDTSFYTHGSKILDAHLCTVPPPPEAPKR